MKSKFKVGDRVRVTRVNVDAWGDHPQFKKAIGEVFTVQSVDGVNLSGFPEYSLDCEFAECWDESELEPEFNNVDKIFDRIKNEVIKKTGGRNTP